MASFTGLPSAFQQHGIPSVASPVVRVVAPRRLLITRSNAIVSRSVIVPRSGIPRGILFQRRQGGLTGAPLSPPPHSDNTQNGGSTSGNDTDQPSSSSSESQGEEPGWARKAFQLPLEVASVLSNEDSHYLAKRSRSRWWRRKGTHFPLLPADSLEDTKVKPPPLKLWHKVLPLGMIFFGASFNLSVLHSLKDAIMVTTAGAETLPFLASLVVLPASLGFFLLYGKLVETLPSRVVFYAAIAPLVAFYALFAGVLYPAHSVLHPTGLVEAAASWMPTGLMGLVKVVQYWTFSLFYCAAELWGSVVISVLFWTLANEVCTVAEAKSVYPLMGIAANVALVLSGSFVKLINRIPAVANGSTQVMLNGLVGGIVAMTAAMLIAKASLDKFVIGDDIALDPKNATKPAVKEKSKGNLADSFRIIRGSSKITSLAVLVVSYGVSHRLFEFSWKGALRALYPTAQGYQGVLADVAIATGYATISFMLLGKFVFQYLGWRAAASVTPLAMLLTGGSFFGLSLAASYGVSIGGLSPVAMAFAGVTAGAATQVFARSSKFSFFDPAKEMCYIEMSKEEKSKGKAAVDLLGSQIGKSGGAWITQLLLLATGSLTASLPIISIAFLGVIGTWLAAVGSLHTQLQEYEAEKEAAEKARLNGSGSSTGHSDDVTASMLESIDEGDENDNNGVIAGVQPQMAS